MSLVDRSDLPVLPMGRQVIGMDRVPVCTSQTPSWGGRTIAATLGYNADAISAILDEGEAAPDPYFYDPDPLTGLPYVRQCEREHGSGCGSPLGAKHWDNSSFEDDAIREICGE